MDSTGIEISAGNAAKIAADLTVFALQTGMDIDAVIDVWSNAHASITDRLVSTTEVVVSQAATTFSPVSSIQQNFPGTTVVEQAAPAAPAIVAPTFVQAAAPAPAPIPGVQSGADPVVAQAWDQFFADIQSQTWANNWEDLRPVKAAGKMKPNGPDFKHKSWKPNPSDKWPVSLWIVGKENPADLPARLAAVGIS